MLFSSITFLYYFLPLTLVLYFAAPRWGKNTVLLLASLVFYAWGEPKYIFLMAASILSAYGLTLLMEYFQRQKKKRSARLALWLALAVNLAALIYFKYVDFFLSSFSAATGISIKLLGLALPIGISFYTFQILSYVIDVYRGDTPAQRNIIHFAAYVTMFPQLIAGPIVRYTDVRDQLRERSVSLSDGAKGVERFVLGLGKKVLLANALGELCAIFRASGQQSVLFAWLYAIAFSLQIYFDFSGYSDMAIGLGRILGFHFPENFNYPFLSKSVTEFWRRWHMTLGGWFRDYVYIPLGGNRVSALKWLRNLAVVWLLTGLWHGAAWNFVLWGGMFGVLLMVEKLWLGGLLKKLPAAVGHAYTLLLVLLSFVIFNAASLPEMLSDLGKLFGVGVSPSWKEGFYYLRSYGIILLLAVIGATPLPKTLVGKLEQSRVGGIVLSSATPVVLAAILLLCTACLVDGSFNPFLYFRF